MRLRVDAHSPIPIRWQLAEQLKHAHRGRWRPAGSAVAEHPGARRLSRHQSEHRGARDRGSQAERARGGAAGQGRVRGLDTAARTVPDSAARTSLKDAVIRAAALGMTPDDVTMGVLSVAGVGLAALRGAAAILLVECSPRGARLLRPGARGAAPGPGRQGAAQRAWRAPCGVGSRRPITGGRRSRASGTCRAWNAGWRAWGVPVVALLAEAHLETLHRLAQLPSGTRVGRGLRRGRNGPQPGALDRQCGPAEHRAGRGRPGSRARG